MTAESQGATGLESIANAFRSWVCSELSQVSAFDREALRGDYVFLIDQTPRFIVCVDREWAGSLQIESFEPVLQVVYDQTLPQQLSDQEIVNLFEASHRVRVATDSSTLLLLLRGQLKAKVAYLSGRVAIEGDLPAFLKLVGLLKGRGVRPIQESTSLDGTVLL